MRCGNLWKQRQKKLLSLAPDLTDKEEVTQGGKMEQQEEMKNRMHHREIPQASQVLKENFGLKLGSVLLSVKSLQNELNHQSCATAWGGKVTQQKKKKNWKKSSDLLSIF